MIARRCRAGCPIVGKWLHVQQRILCPCCSSVIDLTSSRGVENFKGGSGCWRSGQERRRLVVRRSASSPSPPPSGAGVKRVGGGEGKSPPISKVHPVDKLKGRLCGRREGGRRVGGVNAPKSRAVLLTALFVSVLPRLKSCALPPAHPFPLFCPGRPSGQF